MLTRRGLFGTLASLAAVAGFRSRAEAKPACPHVGSMSTAPEFWTCTEKMWPYVDCRLCGENRMVGSGGILSYRTFKSERARDGWVHRMREERGE